MNAKKSIKKSQRNNPVKKSIRLIKSKIHKQKYGIANFEPNDWKDW